MLKIEEVTRKTDGKFRHPDLALLIEEADIVLVSATIGYALPSGWLRTLSAEISYANSPPNGGTQVWATEITLGELGHRRTNTYTVPTKTDPVFYIATIKTTGKAIAFSPVADFSVTVTSGHKYYKQPTEIAAGQDFTLEDNLHEAIVEYAAYMALIQDGEEQKALPHLQSFYGLIK